MNKETFNRLIKEPASVDPKHKLELAKLMASFPYSANIKLLHLSALLNDTDIHFERELKKTACYISDRRILRKIVRKPIDKTQYIIEDFESPLRVVGNNPELKKEEVDTAITNNQIIESDKIDEKVFSNEIETRENLYEITESEISLEDQKTNNPEIISELDNQIIASAVNASLSVEVSNVNLKDEEPKNKNTENTSTQDKPNEKKSFLDWIGVENSTKESSQIDPKIKERLEFRKKAEDLINQFILDQPRIDAKREFFSPGNMAKKSIEDQNKIVSETLAKVYANQGNNSKAIATYEQLILKNPEKKTYFASLIKDLKSI